MNEKNLHNFYQAIVDLSHDGIAVIDKKGYLIFYNQAAADFLGIPIGEALGKLVTEVNPDAGLARILVEQNVQHEQIRKLGNRTAVINRAPIYLDGELIGAVSSLRDITELQQYEQEIRKKLSKNGLQAKWSFEKIVARSNKMKKILEVARKYAAVSSTVLLLGESGTGKEIIAQGIHLASERKDRAFVALNCAALPENLLESELFGYDDGAFTGAKKGGKPGLFELAHGGTIFLDEIGELPLSLQARLLRVLQERELMRIGGHKIIPVDVRVIAATNKNLLHQIQKGKFRDDLYFRLAILVLKLPPLRERVEDIPFLVEAFLKSWNKSYKLTDGDIQKLQKYPWPGNIRELRNLIERALVLTTSDESLELFSSDVWMNTEEYKQTYTSEFLNPDETEEDQIKRILKEENGSVGHAASRLGIHRSTLWRKLKNMNLKNQLDNTSP
jgi:PAS domain S-box-containing protein